MTEMQLVAAIGVVDMALSQCRLTREEHAQVNAAMQVLVGRAQAAEELIAAAAQAPVTELAASSEPAVAATPNRAQRRASGRVTPKKS